jgi:hypothetical protein
MDGGTWPRATIETCERRDGAAQKLTLWPLGN